MKNLSGLAISMAMLLAVAIGIHRSVKVPMLKHGKRLFGGGRRSAIVATEMVAPVEFAGSRS